MVFQTVFVSRFPRAIWKSGHGSPTLFVGSPLRDEPTLGSRRSGIHVATAVEVIVNFSSAADHPAIQEDRECRCLEVTLSERAALVVLPQQSQQECRYHGVDVDAEDVW